MAGADMIQKKIIDDAKADAEATLQEAQERVRLAKARTKRAMDEAREGALEEAKAAAEQKRERRLRMARLDERKEELAVKRALIDDAFALAEKKLTALDAANKEKLYTRMLLEAAMGGEELIPAQVDKAMFTPELMAKFNEALSKAGRGTVTLSDESRELGGGFVLRAGGMECNCSLEALLRQSRELLEPLAVRELFSGLEG